MRTRITAIFFGAAAAAWGQQPAGVGPEIKMTYEQGKNLILRSAEKMPEEHYSFRPVDTVRTFGQILGHIADAQYLFCSSAKNEKLEPRAVEKNKTTKADLTSALKEAFAYCDGVYNSLNDASGAETVKLFGRDRTRSGALAFSNAHNYEHYGNLVTYMRIKGLVPPSSEGRR
jgi:uncharacterized damage-inducible protein DinB